MIYYVLRNGDVKDESTSLASAKRKADNLAFETNHTHLVVSNDSKLMYRAVPGKSKHHSLDAYVKKWYR